jgi:xylulokinase
MLAEDALVSAGSGGNMMRAIGTGKIPAGAVTVSLRTSGMICAFSEQPVVDSQGEIAGFRDGTGHWLP